MSIGYGYSNLRQKLASSSNPNYSGGECQEVDMSWELDESDLTEVGLRLDILPLVIMLIVTILIILAAFLLK